MKQIKQIGVALVLAGLLIGCATNRAVYNTLAGIKVTTDSAVTGYFTLVAKKQASIKGVPAVAAAYDNFEVVWSTAVKIAQFKTNSIASPDVSAAAQNVIATIEVVKGAK